MADTIINAHDGTFKTEGSISMRETQEFLARREGLSTASFHAQGLEGSVSLQKLYDASNPGGITLAGNSAYPSNNYSLGGLRGASYQNNTPPVIDLLGPSVFFVNTDAEIPPSVGDFAEATLTSSAVWTRPQDDNNNLTVFKVGEINLNGIGSDLYKTQITSSFKMYAGDEYSRGDDGDQSALRTISRTWTSAKGAYDYTGGIRGLPHNRNHYAQWGTVVYCDDDSCDRGDMGGINYWRNYLFDVYFPPSKPLIRNGTLYDTLKGKEIGVTESASSSSLTPVGWPIIYFSDHSDDGSLHGFLDYIMVRENNNKVSIWLSSDFVWGERGAGIFTASQRSYELNASNNILQASHYGWNGGKAWLPFPEMRITGTILEI